MGAARTTGLPGMRYGRLTVIEEAERSPSGRRVRCKCDCEAETIARVASLAAGDTRSCGCLARELAGQRSAARKAARLAAEATQPEKVKPTKAAKTEPEKPKAEKPTKPAATPRLNANGKPLAGDSAVAIRVFEEDGVRMVEIDCPYCGKRHRHVVPVDILADADLRRTPKCVGRKAGGRSYRIVMPPE